MMKSIVHRRFNYIDLIGITIGAYAVMNNLWYLIPAFMLLVASVVLEKHYG